jgi:RNA polymerase sigma factor (sigma-70 family)
MSRPRAGDHGSPAPETLDDVEALFHEYHPRVYAYIRYRVAGVFEAEDLTSEIMERALSHLSSFDPRKGAFSTWLFSIAHNTWVNHVKQQRRREPYHVALDAREEDLIADDPTPEEVLVNKEEKTQLLDCLGTLPARQQEILALRFAGRLTNREIARVLRMNERTVSVTILRSLRKLRQKLLETERQMNPA